MKVQHITHKSHEWFAVIDEDPDCDFETGEYIGISDMLKFDNGRWYPKRECVYISSDGSVKSCSS